MSTYSFTFKLSASLLLLILSNTPVFSQSTEPLIAILEKAQNGDSDAMYQLAQNFDLGLGVPLDRGEALKWYAEAANKQHADAAYQLGYASYWGKGVKRDYLNAHNWFIIAAENGHRPSMSYLSKMYRLGQGVKRNKQKAKEWNQIFVDFKTTEAEFAPVALPEPKPIVKEGKKEAIEDIPFESEPATPQVAPEAVTPSLEQQAAADSAALEAEIIALESEETPSTVSEEATTPVVIQQVPQQDHNNGSNGQSE